MANFIPIAGTPDGAGGHLIQPEYAQPLVDAIARASALFNFVSFERTSTRKRKYPRLVGRPTAAFVDEAADVPASGAEFASLEINIKKIGVTLLYTEEELEDAYADPEALLGPEVEEAFAQLIDAHALGQAGGAAIVTSFDEDVWSNIPAGGKVEYDSDKQDALALAVSAGMAFVEGNGGVPNGLALSLDSRQSIRDARDADGRPLYQSGGGDFTRAPDGALLYGLGLGLTSNLDGFPVGAGKTVAIGGDWSYAKALLRRDVSIRVSTEATINVGGTDHRTFQQEKVAVKYTMRCGFNIHQPDKHFFAVTNTVDEAV